MTDMEPVVWAGLIAGFLIGLAAGVVFNEAAHWWENRGRPPQRIKPPPPPPPPITTGRHRTKPQPARRR